MQSKNQYCPLNVDEWRSWLKDNHKTQESVWLIVHKKGSANPTISWSDAVNVALCFGWIDSVKRSIDSEKYMQYFCKRKAVSTWSKINKDKVEDLIQKGLMTEAGLAIIVKAKVNGSWTILDDVENLVIPYVLESAFINNPDAREYFLSLSKSVRKQFLYWIVSAKREETKNKRIAEIIEYANQKLIPPRFI
jgi:uncharacterized protein YdeI (YjbR/CyaY-like superfamily)